MSIFSVVIRNMNGKLDDDFGLSGHPEAHSWLFITCVVSFKISPPFTRLQCHEHSR